jgi:peptidoglycan hydrolase CwlO-like protein
MNERKMKEDYEALKRREEEVYTEYKKLRQLEKELDEREVTLAKRKKTACELMSKLQQ